MRWLASITNSTDTNLSKLEQTLKDRGVWLHRVIKSWTQLSV